MLELIKSIVKGNFNGADKVSSVRRFVGHLGTKANGLTDQSEKIITLTPFWTI